MKLALVSPLPPQPTGVSDYCMELLPHLAHLAEVKLFVQEPAFTLPELARKFEVHPLADLPFALRSGQVELPLYQLGNSRWHATALRYIRQYPGLVVLHDLVLHHLMALLTLERGWLDAYRELVVADHGEAARDWPERLWSPNGTVIPPARRVLTDEDRRRRYYRLPLSKQLISHARGVVVHSQFVADRLRQWHPGLPIRLLPHPAELPQVERAEVRERLGLSAKDYAVGIVGGADENRCIESALQGFAQLASDTPQAKLLVFADKKEALTQRLDQLGLANRTQFVHRTHYSIYLEHLAALDSAIALRFPTCGETSGSAIRLMSVGVPFVTLAVDAYRELPDGACVKLPLSRDLGRQIGNALRRWHREPKSHMAASAFGRGTIERAHDPSRFAKDLLAFAQELRNRPGRPAAVAKQPRVEAITICYNGKKFIGASIQSMLDQDYPNLGVTVIDNASADGSAEYIKQTFPRVNLIVSDKNLGFSAGNNEVFKRSNADWFALLNQDAIARRNWISEMVETGCKRPDIAVVGAKMLMVRCPTIVNSAGISMNQAAWAVDRWIGLRDDESHVVPEEVFGVCGGALMIRADAYRKYGGFDDTFFMYFEDVDLCWRYRLAGQHIYYVPTAVVHHDWHGERGSLDRLERRRYLCERNRWQTLFKNAELKTIRRLWWKMRAYDALRLRIVKMNVLKGESVDYFKMVGRAIRSAFRWNITHLPSVWRRRRQTQRMRTLSDGALAHFLQPGVQEPAHVGDLDAVRDRFSASAVAKITMGKTDQDSLGPGWYTREGDPNGPYQWRWSKPEAYFYLQPTQEAHTLCIRVGDRPVPGIIELWLDGEPITRQPVHTMSVIQFALPKPVPAGVTMEGCLKTTYFRPSEVGNVKEDTRDLGVFVSELWTE